MKNSTGALIGVVIVIITTLICILIAICNTRLQWSVCNTTCSDYGMENDCYVVSQSVIDYIINGDNRD